MATLRPLTPGAAPGFTCPATGPRKNRTRGRRAAGQAMTGDEVRHVVEAMVPQGELDCRCAPCGVIERQRQLKLGMFVRARVLSAGTPGGADPADVLGSSLECEVPPGARSAFSRGFDAPLERFMAALADRARADARAPQVERSGPRWGAPTGPSSRPRR
jgi:hypothetical protein